MKSSHLRTQCPGSQHGIEQGPSPKRGLAGSDPDVLSVTKVVAVPLDGQHPGWGHSAGDRVRWSWGRTACFGGAGFSALGRAGLGDRGGPNSRSLRGFPPQATAVPSRNKLWGGQGCAWGSRLFLLAAPTSSRDYGPAPFLGAGSYRKQESWGEPHQHLRLWLWKTIGPVLTSPRRCDSPSVRSPAQWTGSEDG